MTIKELIDKITNGVSQDAKNNEVLKLIQNKSLPLIDRWALYELAIDKNYLVNPDIYYYIPGHLTKFEDVGYSGHNRHKTYNIYAFLDDHDFTPEQLAVIQEDILQDGHSSWVYDW